jgi:endonuclease/exonuclease/phosphatase family metal-dependent hydrolase
MRIVSYNILDGGVGRADPIAEVLLAQKSDVVGLLEADDPAILDRIAWRLGWDYIAAEGPEHTAALLTRGHILESVNHALRLGKKGPRSFVEALVEVDGGSIAIGLLHATAKATDKRERTREKEIAQVLEVFADRRAAGTPHLLMGDFNATSPIQRIDPARLKPKSRKAFDKQGDLPRRVIQHVLDAGYTDTLAAIAPDLAATAGTFSTLHPGQRVDYIFSYGLAANQISAAWVETDRLATYASDHYPVGAELRVRGED